MRMAWQVETLNKTVDKELFGFDAELQASFLRISELVETHGPYVVGRPYVAHLRRDIWEMRLSGDKKVARALFVVLPRQRIVVVRAFVKKTQRIPPREIRLAERRAKTIEI